MESYQNRNAFSSISLVFGIASVLTIITVYLPLPLASLAIIFAVLSKGGRLKFNMTELLTIGLSLFSIIIVLLAIFTSLYIMITNPQFIIEQIELMAPMLEEVYGVTADEIIQQFETSLPFFN